jgi:hypothetical protein
MEPNPKQVFAETWQLDRVGEYGSSAFRTTMGGASASEVHSIPDMRAAASAEFGPTYVDVRKCIGERMRRK